MEYHFGVFTLDRGLDRTLSSECPLGLCICFLPVSWLVVVVVVVVGRTCCVAAACLLFRFRCSLGGR